MVTDVLERALALGASPAFASLAPEELLVLAEKATVATFGAGERLRDAHGDAVHVVIGGRVRVRRHYDAGPGECVGDMAALVPAEAGADEITATTATRTLRLERDDFLDLLVDHPRVVRDLALLFAARLQGTAAP